MATAMFIEAMQNWITRESKRIETQSAKLAEMQENLRVKVNLKGGVQGDEDCPRGLVARGSIDGQKQEPHHVSGDHGGNQELAFWRGSASKRVAGWTRTEEIASWTLEAQRFNKEVEAKKRNLQEAIEKESVARMGDDSVDGLDGSLSS